MGQIPSDKPIVPETTLPPLQKEAETLSPLEKALGDIVISLDGMALGIYGDKNDPTIYINDTTFQKDAIQIKWKKELETKIATLENDFTQTEALQTLVKNLRELVDSDSMGDFTKFKGTGIPGQPGADLGKLGETYASLDAAFGDPLVDGRSYKRGPASRYDDVNNSQWEAWKEVLKNLDKDLPPGPVGPATPPSRMFPVGRGAAINVPKEIGGTIPDESVPAEEVEPTSTTEGTSSVSGPIPWGSHLTPVDVPAEIQVLRDTLGASAWKLEALKSKLKNMDPKSLTIEIEATSKAILDDLNELEGNLAKFEKKLENSPLYPFTAQFELVREAIQQYKGVAQSCANEPNPSNPALKKLDSASANLFFALNKNEFNLGTEMGAENYIFYSKRAIARSMENINESFKDIRTKYNDPNIATDERNEILKTLSAANTQLQNQFATLNKTLVERGYPDADKLLDFKGIERSTKEFDKLINESIPSLENPNPTFSLDQMSGQFEFIHSVTGRFVTQLSPSGKDALENFTNEEFNTINTYKQELLNAMDPGISGWFGGKYFNKMSVSTMITWMKGDDEGYRISFKEMINLMKTKLETIRTIIMKSPLDIFSLDWGNRINLVSSRMDVLVWLVDNKVVSDEAWANSFDYLVGAMRLLPGKGSFREVNYSQPLESRIEFSY